MPDLQLHESIWCEVFKHDVEAYFSSREDTFPYDSLEDIIATGLYAGEGPHSHEDCWPGKARLKHNKIARRLA